MNFKLLPFFELAEENKRKHGKEGIFDPVTKYEKITNNFNFEVYKYHNFCAFDGSITDLLIIFSGNHYELLKF